MGDIVFHLTLSQSRNGILRKHVALASLLSILFLNGCMAGKTRSLPFTEYPPSSADIAYLKKATIAVRPFDISSTVLTGGHHEGLMQVRQPGIWGLSKEQQKSLYGDLGNIVRYAFIDELMKRNQRVIILGQSFPTRKPDYTVTGVVRSVELNTSFSLCRREKLPGDLEERSSSAERVNTPDSSTPPGPEGRHDLTRGSKCSP